MQPQDTGGIDWWHAVSGMGGAVVGAGSTLLTWIVRAARMEPKINAEIKAAEHRVEGKMDEMVSHFQEAFAGIRRQIDDHKLHTETNFARKDDIREFREEHREDMREIKQMIANLPRRQ
jgi:esterase/lipase